MLHHSTSPALVPRKVVAMDMKDLSPDIDPQETREWIEALDSVLDSEGVERAHFLLERLVERARRSGAYIPFSATTAYLNTIPVSREERLPGDNELEARLRALVRWNAMAMVVRANKDSSELGGHIASFASAATLYDDGFNHFFRGMNDNVPGLVV
jgi:pyruvate dehydrogenase E1 component